MILVTDLPPDHIDDRLLTVAAVRPGAGIGPSLHMLAEAVASTVERCLPDAAARADITWRWWLAHQGELRDIKEN
jgi:hypothetical protein